MSTSSVYTSAHLYLYICVCTCVYHIHTPHTHIYHGSWQDGVCIYLRIYVCVDVPTVMEWESWQAQMVWFGVWLTCPVFSFLHLLRTWWNTTEESSAPTPGGPYLLHTAFSPLEHLWTRKRLLRDLTFCESTQSHHNSTPDTLGKVIALLCQVVEINWHRIRKTRLSRSLFNFKVIRTVCL